MQFNNLKRNKANRKAKQVGRGGTRGKTSGRGTKGQNARSGRKKRPEMRDIIKKIPKLRGRGVNYLKSGFVKPRPVSAAIIEKNYKDGEVVSLESLRAKGIIDSTENRVKVLGGAKLSKRLKFEVPISKSLKTNE